MNVELIIKKISVVMQTNKQKKRHVSEKPIFFNNIICITFPLVYQHAQSNKGLLNIVWSTSNECTEGSHFYCFWFNTSASIFTFISFHLNSVICAFISLSLPTVGYGSTWYACLKVPCFQKNIFRKLVNAYGGRAGRAINYIAQNN